jgi:hypothetical protein
MAAASSASALSKMGSPHPAGFLDQRRHLGREVGVGAARGVRLDLLARHKVGVELGAQVADLLDPSDDLDAVALGQELARDGASGHAGDGLAGRGAPPAAPVAQAVLGLVGVVAVRGAVGVPPGLVLGGVCVLVDDHELERRARGAALEEPREDLGLVGLLAGGDELGLPRAAAA